MNKLVDIANLIKKDKNVAIVCHFRPDGDAIGSAVALGLALNKIGINTKLFCDDVIPKKFAFLNTESYFSRKLTDGFDIYVAVDCADILRMGEDNAEVFSRQKITVNVDHHVSNTRYAKYNYVFDNSANCENIYELINELNIEIDKQIADFLLMGIMTDTGNFKHKNVSPNTMSVASKLLEKQADINTIHYNTFTKQSKARAKLFGGVMSSLRYFLDDRLCLGTVTQKALQDSGALLEDTEGFIDFIMGIDTVEVGICISEIGKNKFKCSFRSKGTDVNQVAGVFGGGGHILASGCQIQGEYEEVVDKLRFAVSQHIREN